MSSLIGLSASLHALNIASIVRVLTSLGELRVVFETMVGSLDFVEDDSLFRLVSVEDQESFAFGAAQVTEFAAFFQLKANTISPVSLVQILDYELLELIRRWERLELFD